MTVIGLRGPAGLARLHRADAAGGVSRVEIWTQAAQPAPGARIALPFVAGQTPDPGAEFSAAAPDLIVFRRGLATAFVAHLATDARDDS